jgi:hypothetical protein
MKSISLALCLLAIHAALVKIVNAVEIAKEEGEQN